MLVKQAIDRLARTADPRRTLRVLEVGGGTGGLTTHVLGALPADRSEYVFTDVSASFAQAAGERFRDYPFVECRTLDLESDLLDQGIDAGSFDLVLAADVVHATTDLKGTVLRLQEALAPGGILALIEADPDNRFLDLTFGLTTGWWAFRDLQLRPDGPLLTAPAWERLLRAAGYDDVLALSDHEGAGSQSVLLARAPASVAADRPPTPRDGESERLGEWLIVGEADALSEGLAHRIGERGGRAVLVAPGSGDDYDRLLSALEPQGVVHLCNGPETDAPEVTALAHCRSITDLLAALDRKRPDEWPRVYVLTRGAHALRNDAVHIEGAPAWGLGLVAGLELPQSRLTLIDLDTDAAPGELDDVWAELWPPNQEREVALRAGERFTRRLVTLPPDELVAPVDARDLPADSRYRLEMESPGSLDGLRYRETPRIAPGPGQVEVEVVAAGLNFLDVMTALGQVPLLDSAHGYHFGAECTGIVTRVGEGVAGLHAGDAVVAVSSAQGALASHITLDAGVVVAKPEALGFEEAATVPIVFLTAWYALEKLARLQPGERVLIHSAAGGTGLAALQIARRAGAEVFATAGTPAKRALLRALGVKHVMDSRSLAFADEVKRATGGTGVDVVLNAIAGEAVDRSIACLAPYGRFVEIGKRDLLGDRRLGLRPFLANLSYFSFDLRQMLVDRPQAVRDELERVLELFERGELRPLPSRAFQPSQAETAFRHLAAAKHVGKLVVAMDEREVRVVPAPEPPLAAAGGTWLITGGLGGVGLSMADALADAGVRSLVLIGRSGVRDDATRARIASLRERGVEVLADAVDVTSRPALEALFARIERELPPLRGVLHAAMLLDDALLTDMDEARLERVIAPKAVGAWHLHELTADMPLDAFVLFSSATSMVGNIGQSNYAAANAFLDHLAETRRARGQRALAVNWGAVSDVGYVARHEDVARLVEATGMRGFTSAQAFEALAALVPGSVAQVGVLPMDWPQFLRHHDLEANPIPRYAQLIEAHGEGAQANGHGPAGGSLRQQLRSNSNGELDGLLRSALKDRVAAVLGIALDDLDEDMPLMDYLDSLLAVEISSWIEREVGAKVTIMELMKGPSIGELAAQLLAQLGEPQPTAVAG
jgi:NADPH:quinone reductase-like Zn-dependent oxidoreductase/NADP-dependent 3-hydroxy acid dehydrogenase YdfG/aryl carrier-like protein